MRQRKNIFGKMYGIDSLSCGLLLLTLLLNLAALTLNTRVQFYMAVAAYIPLLIALLRFISVSHDKRWRENQAFLRLLFRLGIGVEKEEKGEMSNTEEPKTDLSKEEKKLFKIFDCPNCRQRIRVPKNKGRIEITCPQCGTKFIKKT